MDDQVLGALSFKLIDTLIKIGGGNSIIFVRNKCSTYERSRQARVVMSVMLHCRYGIRIWMCTTRAACLGLSRVPKMDIELVVWYFEVLNTSIVLYARPLWYTASYHTKSTNIPQGTNLRSSLRKIVLLPDEIRIHLLIGREEREFSTRKYRSVT